VFSAIVDFKDVEPVRASINVIFAIFTAFTVLVRVGFIG
jgi:hypothetical protein